MHPPGGHVSSMLPLQPSMPRSRDSRRLEQGLGLNDIPAPLFRVLSGDCQSDGSCVSTPNYPDRYDSSYCDIELILASQASTVLTVMTFDTEAPMAPGACNDYVDLIEVGKSTRSSFCGSSGPDGVAVDTRYSMRWRTDSYSHGNGWMICAVPPPSPPPPTSYDATLICGNSCYDAWDSYCDE